MANDKVTFEIIGRDTSGSKAFRAVGDAADRAGEQVEDLGDKTRGAGDDAKGAAPAWRGLADEIAATQQRMRDLAAEIDRTGNLDLAKDIRRQQAELRKLTRARDLLGDAGEDSADAFSSSFSRRLHTAFARMPISPPLVAAVAAAVPAVTTLLAGAVTGGVATGAVAAGVALAARDPAIQTAGKALGAELGEGLTEAAESFVPAVGDAISSIRAEFVQLKPELAAIFEDASEYLGPLTDAALGFVRNVIPGLRDATGAARPFFDMLKREVPELGTDIAEMLKTLSEHADEGAESLGALLDVVGGLADTVSVATDVVAVLKEYTTWPGGEETVKIMGKIPPAAEDAADGIKKVGGAARATAVEVETMSAMIQRLSDANLNAEQANLALSEAINRAAEAGRRNNAGISDNSDMANANRAALLGIAEAAKRAADATMQQTGSQELANGTLQRGRDAFLRAAAAMGVGAAEAKRLADQLFGIPTAVTVKVKVDTQRAEAQARALVQRINNMRARIRISAEPSGGFGGTRGGGEGHAPGLSEGGRIEGPGTGTSDDIVARVSRGEYVIREAAARAIGYDTLDALNQADRRSVGAAASGTGSTTQPPRRTGDDERLVALLRRGMSGLTLVLDDRTGRTATLMVRSG